MSARTPRLRKVSAATGMRAAASFQREVNETWMEAIDTDSHRLYFVKLEVSEAGDAVRPQGETAWEAPPGFLVRHELVAALSSVVQPSGGSAEVAQEDEDAFLAKVRERFP